MSHPTMTATARARARWFDVRNRLDEDTVTELLEHAEEREDLQLQMESLQVELRQEKEAHDETQGEVEDLERKVQDLESENRELETERDRLLEQVDALRHSHASAVELQEARDAVDLWQARAAGQTARGDTLLEANRKMVPELDALRTSVARLHEENVRLLDQVTKAIAESRKADERCIALETTIRTLIALAPPKKERAKKST